MSIVCLIIIAVGASCFGVATSSAHISGAWNESDIVADLQGAPQSGLPLNPAKYPYIWRNSSALSLFNSTAGRVAVLDPYQWLEDTSSSATESFVDAQRALYTDWSKTNIRPFSTVGWSVQRLWAQLRVPAPACPHTYTLNRQPETGAIQLGDLVFLEIADEAPIFFNMTALMDGELLNLNNYEANVNMTWLSVTMSNGVSDWARVYLFSINNITREATPLNETLNKVAVFNMPATWSPDGQSLLYQMYPQGSNVSMADRGHNSTGVSDASPSLMVHTPNTPQSADIRLLSFPDQPSWHVNDAYFSNDGSYLSLTFSDSEPSGKKVWGLRIDELPRDPKTGNLDFSTYNLDDKNHSAVPWLKIVNDNFLFDYSVDDIEGDIWTVRTNYNAPNYMVVLINVTDALPQEAWKVLVPQDPDLMLSAISQSFTSIDKQAARGGWLPERDTLLLVYRKGLVPLLQIRNVTDGHLIGQYGPPTNASIGGSITKVCARRDAKDFYFVYTSLDSPGTLYRATMDTAQTSAVTQRTLPQPFNKTGLKTEVHYVPSQDGQVQIPLLILMQGNTSTGGGTSYPTLLYGYGGQNVIEPNIYTGDKATWVFGFNGIYAKCLARGGGDLGRAWWSAAAGVNKTKTGDDFVACAQYLIARNYTSPDNLVIEGASNGGLLMGMAVTKAPGLFTGVIAGSGLYDMLHVPQQGDAATVAEYGDARNSQEFDDVLKYSPLQNIRQPNGTQQYPAMLITTGTADDRVRPSHTYKFVAQLQETLTRSYNSPQLNPIVMYPMDGEGHTGISRWTVLLFASGAINATWALPTTPLPLFDLTSGFGEACNGPLAGFQKKLAGLAIGCVFGGVLLAAGLAGMLIWIRKCRAAKKASHSRSYNLPLPKFTTPA